jgi:hypothetical protein
MRGRVTGDTSAIKATRRAAGHCRARSQFMTKEDARIKIVAQWPKWAKANYVEQGTGGDAMLFFNFIQDKRPDLLTVP